MVDLFEAIKAEYEAFKEQMYAGKSKEERDDLGQFFTPAEYTIEMIKIHLDCDKDFLSKTIIDTTSGSGNLLSACIVAGADPSKIFGNDYDPVMVKLCRQRIKTIPDRLEKYDSNFAAALRVKLSRFNDWQVHRGDAIDEFCISEFGPDYKQKLINHYLYDTEYVSLFPELTKDQEEFLKEVD